MGLVSVFAEQEGLLHHGLFIVIDAGPKCALSFLNLLLGQV